MVDPTDVQEDMMMDDDEEEKEQPGFHTPKGSPKPEDMAAEYMVDQEDWAAKTHLDINDPARVAALEQWEHLFPECAHHQPVYDGFLETFLKARTSVGGKSRDEYKSILQSMFGGSADDSGSMVGLLSQDMFDDD